MIRPRPLGTMPGASIWHGACSTVCMTGKLLQVIGVITILGLVAGSIAGFGILKDRVRVVIEADDTDLGPDPMALLRDDVAGLSGSLMALQKAVGSNFEQLANGLESGAEARHGDVKQLLRAVAQLTAQAEASDAAIAQLQVKVDTLSAMQRQAVDAATLLAVAGKSKVGAPEVPKPTAKPEVEPVLVVAKPVDPAVDLAVDLAVAPSPVVLDEVALAEVTKPKPKRGFLSFSLPTTQRAFDQPQEYLLLPKLCRVGFDAKSTLHDFTGVTSAVTGRFRADFDDPKGLCIGEVTATAGDLKTGVDGRDTNMWEYLDSKDHPQISFAIERFVAAENGVDVAAKKARGEVVGKMTIRGKTLSLRMPVEIEMDPQQRVIIKGQTKLKLSDYGVPVPSQLGVINMEDEVVIWLALRARAQAEAGK
ncbi:MAG: polyisoprenoid-binding protein YceI [Planctomycetota bacterium]|jgi:polyisoprenoid-binding protein YceI